MQVIYHPKVLSEDIPRLSSDISSRIKKAIEQRLMAAPDKYLLPLKRGLKGYRKMRVGPYRIVYSVVGKKIRIIVIGHRKDVYSKTRYRI